MSRKRATPKYEEEFQEQETFITFKKVKLTAKQTEVHNLINTNKITVITGPAGTAKSFIACYSALKLISQGKDYEKIVITKPTVIVGNSELGYMPGTLDEKLGVYMENFNDVFEDILEPGVVNQLYTAQDIQFKAPQFVRGRTFKNSIIIIDEFQSFDIHELIALITRMGKTGCKIILCGDIKQNDIARKYVAVNLLKKILLGLPDTAQFEFTKEDNMRDPLVQMIIERYEELETLGEITPNKKNA